MEGGPSDLADIQSKRVTQIFYIDGRHHTITDSWDDAGSDHSLGVTWTGITMFWDHNAPPEVTQAEVDANRVVGPKAESVDAGTVDRSKPYSGVEPPKPLMPDDNVEYRRRIKDGVWCVVDQAGRMYPVDNVGQRWYKPKPGEDKRDWNKRAPDLPRRVWNLMTNAEKRNHWNIIWSAEDAAKKKQDESSPSSSSTSGLPDAATPVAQIEHILQNPYFSVVL